MKEKNKTLLGIGLILIVVAFLCALFGLYLLGNASLKKENKIASLQAQLVNLISEKSRNVLSEKDAQRVQRGPINEEDLIEKAEAVYGPQELERKEGILWIDRKARTLLVTLGVVNGLKKGDILGVYENDNRIGEVIVDKPYDIISYVRPNKMSLNDFKKSYYRVVNEALP